MRKLHQLPGLAIFYGICWLIVAALTIGLGLIVARDFGRAIGRVARERYRRN